MCDRYTGTFEILKSDIERYPELKKAIEDQFYRQKKYPDPPENKDNWEEQSPVANFIDTKARYGHFEELETLCMKLNVPFDSWNESYGGCEDSVVRVYRPDVSDEILYQNGEGNFTYTENDLRKLIKNIKRKKDSRDGLNYTQKVGEAFLQFLNEIPQIKPLEKYEGWEPRKIRCLMDATLSTKSNCYYCCKYCKEPKCDYRCLTSCDYKKDEDILANCNDAAELN